MKVNTKPTWVTSKLINVLDKPPSRQHRLLYQTGSRPELRSRDEANDPISSPFPFFPPLPSFTFQPFVQPLYGTGNYVLLVNRVARLEDEIRRLKQKVESLDSFLSCVNMTTSPKCAGPRPQATYVPVQSQGTVPFSGGQYVVSSQSAGPEQSTGVLVSSTYNNPAGSQGQGTLTVEHFSNNPKV